MCAEYERQLGGAPDNRTSFVPETGENTLHEMRTDERRCIGNAAEFAGMSNERLEVLKTPTIGNRMSPEAL
jgi:hypothetical protein